MGELNKNDKSFIFGLFCIGVGMAVPQVAIPIGLLGLLLSYVYQK